LRKDKLLLLRTVYFFIPTENRLANAKSPFCLSGLFAIEAQASRLGGSQIGLDSA